MRLQMNEQGVVRVQEAGKQDFDLFAGPVNIGRMSNSGAVFPLHGLARNISHAMEFGLTAKPIDKSERRFHSIDISGFIESYYGVDALLEHLQKAIRGGKWTVYAVWIERSRFVVVDIGIVLPMSLTGVPYTVLCEGHAPIEGHACDDPYFEQSHWFMPSGNVMGGRYRFEIDAIPPFLEFTVAFQGKTDGEALDYGPISNYTNSTMLEGLPDLKRIHRVASANANHNSFLNGGRTVYNRLKSIAERYDVALVDETLRILDWGVGCGRVIRHFEELETPNLWGMDIDSDNVDFCNQTLRSKSIAVGLNPPTQLQDEAFDLIYSCSVLSHLTEEAADAWLAEMARLLSARGVALISFNGSSNSASYLSRRPGEFRHLLSAGFFDKDVNHELDGFIPGNDYYRATFASDEWWMAKFEQFFDVAGIEYAVVNGHQDIAVLKRRA